ncbi:MAG: hypothetical protein ACK5LJ_15465 [Paracoccus sp. (in: a-proteobacteria)]
MLKNECSRNCWLAAAVVGLLVWIFNGTFFGGLILGLITCFLLGSLLIWIACEGAGGPVEGAEVLDGRPLPAHPENDAGVLNRAEQAVVDASHAFSAGTVAAVAKGREALHDFQTGTDGEEVSLKDRASEGLEHASEAVKSLAMKGKEALDSLYGVNEGEAKPEAETKPSPPAESVIADQPLAEPVALQSAPVETDQVLPAQVDTDPKDAVSAGPAPVKPAKLAASEADNLKEIKGVGPALETLLHENGVTSFAQIAGWNDADIDRYAELIGRMGGRIRSDDWVAQAKILAAGGDTEFSSRVDRGEVY